MRLPKRSEYFEIFKIPLTNYTVRFGGPSFGLRSILFFSVPILYAMSVVFYEIVIESPISRDNIDGSLFFYHFKNIEVFKIIFITTL